MAAAYGNGGTIQVVAAVPVLGLRRGDTDDLELTDVVEKLIHEGKLIPVVEA